MYTTLKTFLLNVRKKIKMDTLDSLPINEKESLNPQHKSILEKYIGGPATKSESAPQNAESNFSSSERWKVIGYASLIFVLIANPFIQSLLDKAPYFGGNNLKVLLLSVLLFIIITTFAVMLG
jgi:hypothetical protein